MPRAPAKELLPTNPPPPPPPSFAVYIHQQPLLSARQPQLAHALLWQSNGAAQQPPKAQHQHNNVPRSCMQQERVLQDHLGDLPVKALTGQMDLDSWRCDQWGQVLSDHSALVMTPQALYNALTDGHIKVPLAGWLPLGGIEELLKRNGAPFSLMPACTSQRSSTSDSARTHQTELHNTRIPHTPIPQYPNTPNIPP
jgi:hypothetical protein